MQIHKIFTMLKKERPNILIDAKKVLDSVQLESKQQNKEGIHEKAGDAKKNDRMFWSMLKKTTW